MGNIYLNFTNILVLYKFLHAAVIHALKYPSGTITFPWQV